jgi:MFS family permease
LNIKWLIRSQSIVTLAAGMIYPYYLLFLKNLGNSYSKYGLAFAVYTLSSAVVSQWLASRIDRNAAPILVASSLGMMAAMIAFPWVFSYGWVLFFQCVMGACSAMQKMSERILLC